MKKTYFLPIVCVLMLAIMSIPGALCYPPYPSAGFDHFNFTTATIELHVTVSPGFTETINATGPTDVKRNDSYPSGGRMKIDTEIISMNLVGTSVYIGPITISESLTKKSTGYIQEQTSGTWYPADSFFDVFIDIHTVVGTFHNDDPAIMSTTLYYPPGIPPWGAIYQGQNNVTLKNEEGFPIGFILHVIHKLPQNIGGAVVPIDKLGLLAPYIGLASTVLITAAASVIYVKHRKKNQ